ncbi:hypothetical protein THMA_0847 [Thermotoga maritima MSB8]|uniref:Uncharacterized protein n=1 Tax=Thermotoga maritima (strain ATCC 43589 / DSM 3109 / JCM 10099 / NBRC 100826 / MSB8) TaxID=243274 RepID=Q9WZT3_THEMA|nr:MULTISPECIES: hypothetical protein [Thermotoga]AAD35908.1 hypothetical protein TM_0826 [Thermotoga maritima MSB8]AGL49753.1 hypothetical protein Tmari_0828 [Thermotoga maritima MSB8]AHD17421.1 hypothetical protein THEMA_00510 [Thermotoga maritima MSB8]AIY85653.1 hypothetical protein T2812B_00510 [Thermotoga sp. 2812B]AKE26741.1 hypothetical protein THMC_0847 [Thermotoga maritima]
MEKKVSRNPRVLSQIDLLKLMTDGDESALREIKRRLGLDEKKERDNDEKQKVSDKI